MKHIAAVVAGLSLAFVGTSNAWATEGACCIVTTSYGEDPTNACSQMTSADCELAGGVYLGGDCSDAVCRTITICASGCDHWHVQTAIDDSSDGDLLYAHAATHSDDLCSLTTKGKKITIAGKTDTDGTPLTTFKKGCAGFESVFYLHEGEGPQTVIQDLIITGGNPPRGGGMNLNTSSPTITNCTIKDNSAQRGAGIYCGGSSSTITNCTILSNEGNTTPLLGYGGGGIWMTDSHLTITDCQIAGNLPAKGGGIWMSNSSVQMNATSITNNFCNTTTGFGAGIYLRQSHSTAYTHITNCTFSGNHSWRGGGIYIDAGQTPFITDCTITNNLAYEGGGLYVIDDGSVNIHGCHFKDNTASYKGADIYHSYPGLRGGLGIITLENSTICGTGDHVVGIIRHVGNNIISDCIDDGDMDNDGDVDTDDLSALHDTLEVCTHDTNHDGVTGIDDLLDVIDGWGQSCTP